MSNYNSLKTTINANIKQNGNQEITGQILNSVLNAMVNALGAGYQYAGVATTATNPGSPDAKVFYIANGKGTYTNFGGINVTEDNVVVLYWDSSWHKEVTGIVSQEQYSELIGGRFSVNCTGQQTLIQFSLTAGQEISFNLHVNSGTGTASIFESNAAGTRGATKAYRGLVEGDNLCTYTPVTSCDYILIVISRVSTTITNLDFIVAKEGRLEVMENRISANESAIQQILPSLDTINGYAKNFLDGCSNHFDASSEITLPEAFSDFFLPIKVSVGDVQCGCNVDAYSLRKNTTGTKTYFVSPTGLDTNNGLYATSPFKTLEKALGKSDVETIVFLPGSYSSGVNYQSGTIINKEVNLIGLGVVRFMNASLPLHVQSPVYVQGIEFYGGNTALDVTLEDDVCVFVDCKFNQAQSTNGLNAVGGHLVLYRCEASNNAYDGFSYHRNVVGTTNYPCEVLEINCCGYFNGQLPGSGSQNCSTCHDFALIVRVNCEYGVSYGGVIADTNNSYVVNAGVTSFGSNQFDSPSTRCASFECLNGTKMYMYKCCAFGSLYDLMCIGSRAEIFTDRIFMKTIASDGGQIHETL